MIMRRWLWVVIIAYCFIGIAVLEMLACPEVSAQNPAMTSTPEHCLYLPLVAKNYRVEHRHGDWIVTGPESVGSVTIYLDGNLFIRPTGSLTLTHVTLLMGQNSPGMYQILAEPGSSVVISDSTIAPLQTDRCFAFVVQGASFVLKNSRLEGMMHPSMETRGGGLSLINVTGAILDGNTITHHDSYGVWLTDSLSNTITNNTITCTGPDGTTGAIFLEYSHNNTITHNRLYRQWDALDIQQSWNNYIADNELTLTDHTIGISIWQGSGNNVITHNRISVHPGYEGKA